eukprot:gene6577-6203_t
MTHVVKAALGTRLKEEKDRNIKTFALHLLVGPFLDFDDAMRACNELEQA